MKKITLFLVALLTATFAFAYDVIIDDIYYNLDKENKTATLVHIYKTNSTYFTVPETITCNQEKYSVTSIGFNAFKNCHSLSSITIPSSITSIEKGAFFECLSLTTITVNKDNKTYTSINGVLYNKDITTLIYFPRGRTEVIIPNSITSIGEYAFYYCSSLKSVTIPNGVTSIGEYAFYNCSSLTSISIPNSITYIGNKAFYYTPWLNNQPDGCVYAGSCLYEYKGTMPENTHIDIKEGTTQICDEAFEGCTSLTSITIPNSIISIGKNAFNECNSLNEIRFNIDDLEKYINSGINKLCFQKFYSGYKIVRKLYKNDIEQTNLIIPNTVTTIPEYTFYGCTSLTSITIPNSVTSIGNAAFCHCEYLSSISISNNITSISDSAFYCCLSLASVSIPNNVTSIGNKTFSYCSSLTSITIPTTINSISYNAFYGCDSFDSIKITTTSIEDYCNSNINESLYNSINENFYNTTISRQTRHLIINNEEITDLIIPETIDTIKAYAFYKFVNLKSITTHNNIKSIKNDAFEYCNSSIPINITTPSIEDYCNSDINKILYYYGDLTLQPRHLIINNEEITDLIIPETINTIKEYAFYNFTNIKSLTIPYSMRQIKENAFNKCLSLSNIQWNAKKCNDFSSESNAPFYLDYNTTSQITSFVFGDSVEHIPAYLCYAMDNLTSITLPSSVVSIGTNAFKSANSYMDINITASSMEEYCNSKVNQLLYQQSLYSPDFISGGAKRNLIINNEILTSLIIPNSINTIQDYAFYGFNSITSVEINNSVNKIGRSSFYGCRSLTSINIPNTITEIGHQAFYVCKSLTSITIPNSVTSIGEKAFSYCSSLSSITIPNSITSIGDNAFSGCGSLTTVQWNAKKCNDFYYDEPPFENSPISSFTFGDSIEYIPASLFYNMSNLSSITIPNSVTKIGNYAFYSCSSLTSITIPNSVTNITDATFKNCSKLRTIKLGNAIETIGENVFQGCTALYSFEITTKIPPIISASTFTDVSRTMQVKVPCSAVADYQASNYWNEFTNFVENPYTLTAVANDETMGVVTIIKQPTCQDITSQIVAQPLPGYEFVKWSDGSTENPYEFYITENTELYAYFKVAEATNVETSKISSANIYTTNGTLHIEGATSDYHILDAAGRLIYSGNATTLTLPRGIYLVTINGEVEKIVL